MARGENTADHPGRRVHREVFDRTIVSGAEGQPVRRLNVSRYDEAGNFISQGYSQPGDVDWHARNAEYERQQKRNPRTGLYPDER